MILLNYYLHSQAHTRHFPRHAKYLQGFLLQGTWHVSWKQYLLMLVNLAQHLVYVFTICSQSDCRSSIALCNLYCPSSFPKAVYYLLNFKVCSLAPGTLLSSASPGPLSPWEALQNIFVIKPAALLIGTQLFACTFSLSTPYIWTFPPAF